MGKDFLTAVQERRSYYGISKEMPLTEMRVQELVELAVKHAPSAFHSQSARVIVLFGAQHDKLWNLVKAALAKIVPPDRFGATEEKINGSFLSGYGTVLYFEDQETVAGLQKEFAPYAANFPGWSLQSSGMLQFIIWTALEAEGLGASLQHYNEVIEADVQREWQVPPAWKLIAQMPFGKPAAAPPVKEFKPLAERLRIYK